MVGFPLRTLGPHYWIKIKNPKASAVKREAEVYIRPDGR
jgi:hypothetical protein